MTQYKTHFFPLNVIATGLLVFSVSGAFAQGYAVNGSYATSDGAIATGEEAYATATNGIATGTAAVATGENLDRDKFKARREKYQELEQKYRDAITKQTELDNAIYEKEQEISNTEYVIRDMESRLSRVKTLLEKKKVLDEQKATKITEKNDNQAIVDAHTNRLTQLNPYKLNSNILNDFEGLLTPLDWSKSGTDAGRTELAGALRTRIEKDLPEVVGLYSDEQYRAIIDGYVTRQATRVKAEENIYKQIRNTNLNLRTLEYDFYGRASRLPILLFNTEVNTAIPTDLNFTYINKSTGSYAYDQQAQAKKKMLYFSFI